jgi:predicted lipoprotein with Yx(FWY)xxD motif
MVDWGPWNRDHGIEIMSSGIMGSGILQPGSRFPVPGPVLGGRAAVNQRTRGSVQEVMERSRMRELTRTQRLILRLPAAGLLAATGAIHLDLYLTGYRTIPTIGWLFLLQVISAFLLAAAVLVSGSRLVALAAAGFAIATLAGYLLSIWVGLFGFKEVRTTAGIVAGVIEIVSFALLAFLAATPAAAPAAGHSAGAGAAARSPLLARLQAGVPGAAPAVAAVAVIAAVLLIVAVAGAGGGSSSTAAPSGSALKTEVVGGVTVLANAKGFTLYSFAPDTPTKSVCNGSCAAYWPPVAGKPAAGSGVTGQIGTIKRANGAIQATYNGHPLYTYIGDNAPGKASGNNVNLNGGLWRVVPVSG